MTEQSHGGAPEHQHPTIDPENLTSSVEAGHETVSRPFDKTTLEEAMKQGLLGDVSNLSEEEQERLAHLFAKMHVNPADSTSTEQQPEQQKGFFSKKSTRVGGTALALVATIATVIGVTSSNGTSAAPQPTSTAAAPVTPGNSDPTAQQSTSPSPESSPSSTVKSPEQLAVDDARIVELETEATVEEFNGTPRSQRLKYVNSIFNGFTGEGTSYFKTQFFDGSKLVEYNPVDMDGYDAAGPATELEDGQLIMDRVLFAEQAMLAQVKNDGTIDHDAAYKMISGIAYSPDSGYYKYMKESIDNQKGVIGAMVPSSRHEVKDTSSFKEMDIDGQAVRYKEITFRDGGKEYIVKVTPVKSQYTGEYPNTATTETFDVVNWLIISQQEAN